MHSFFFRASWVLYRLLKSYPLQQETARMMEHHTKVTLGMWDLNFILVLYPWGIMHFRKTMYFPRDQASQNASFI